MASVHISLLLLLFLPALLGAQDSPDELRRLARNPVSDAIQVPFVEDIYFDAGRYDRNPNSLQIQPVIPFDISKNFDLVTRIVTTAFTYAPNLTQPNGGTSGSGDTIVSFFLTPANTGKLIWGVGPAILAPTATNAELGGGKWDLGPSFALITEPKWGTAGVLIQNIWSLPGHSNRVSVDQIQIETVFSYNLPNGWYLITAPTVNADWTQANGKRWVVPFGGGVGRGFNIRQQGVDSNVALYYNPIRPTGANYPKWQLSLQFSLIYPKKQKPISR